MDDDGNFTKDAASLAVEEAYPGCSVIPLSRLDVNKTGVDNGDVNYFSASFFVSGTVEGNSNCKTEKLRTEMRLEES